MDKAPGLFEFDDRLKRLSDLGDQLEAFGEAVDFEMFRAEFVAALDYGDGARGGRPPFDPVMMFKILVLQAANNPSDKRVESPTTAGGSIRFAAQPCVSWVSTSPSAACSSSRVQPWRERGLGGPSSRLLAQRQTPAWATSVLSIARSYPP